MENPTQNVTPVALDRLVRDLTGIAPRKRDKILRMIEKLEDELDDAGLVMFSGGSRDGAILLHRETGISIGYVGNYGVFMGGDLPLRYLPNGIEYSSDLSPSAGDFANVKVHTPLPASASDETGVKP